MVVKGGRMTETITTERAREEAGIGREDDARRTSDKNRRLPYSDPRENA